MPTVLRLGSINVIVHIERAERHHHAHFHVEGLRLSSSVRIPDLLVLDGDSLPRRVRLLLRDNMEAIRLAWNELNPQRPV